VTLQKSIQSYASYNLWANQTLTNWVAGKPEEFLSKEVPSSFPSIAQTLSHILDTEKFWLTVLQGSTNQKWVAFSGAANEVIPCLVRQSQELCAYVESLNDTQIIEPCDLNTAWAKEQQPRYEYIQHCINHGSYHRGQVITIARNLGLTDPPTTDYAYYKRSVKQ